MNFKNMPELTWVYGGTCFYFLRNRVERIFTKDEAVDAIMKTVDFIWEFARDFRKDLLITTGVRTFESMIDAELIEKLQG